MVKDVRSRAGRRGKPPSVHGRVGGTVSSAPETRRKGFRAKTKTKIL